MKSLIKSLDHWVLTVQNIERTTAFYQKVLRMQVKTFAQGRVALHFGQQKINLHEVGKEFEPKAKNATSGAADLCFLTDVAIEDVIQHIKRQGVSIIEGPVKRTGAIRHLLSIYIRDPDGNLIEIANEEDL